MLIIISPLDLSRKKKRKANFSNPASHGGGITRVEGGDRIIWAAILVKRTCDTQGYARDQYVIQVKPLIEIHSIPPSGKET